MKVSDLKAYDELGQFDSFDHLGKKRIFYLKKLTGLKLTDLSMESKKMMKRWYKSGKSEKYHWKMNACYFECLRRGKQAMFHRQHQNLRYDMSKF